MRRYLYRLGRFVIDLAVLVASFAFAYLIRFDFELPPRYLEALWLQLPLVVAVRFGVLQLSGAYRTIWRYVGLRDLPTLLWATGYGSAILLASRALPSMFPLQIPFSVILMEAVLCFGGLVAVRVLRRATFESDRWSFGGDETREKVILVGAGHAGVLSIREIRARDDLDIEVIGFVDDDPLKLGSEIAGIRVLGDTQDLPALVQGYAVAQVIITIANADRHAIRRIVEICSRIPVKVRRIPGYAELLRGNVVLEPIRDLDPDVLLGRVPIDFQTRRLAEFLGGRRVMITGAGGSIGSELASQVAQFQPASLILVERAEYALFETHRMLRELWPDLTIIPSIADVGDEPRMTAILASQRPQVVIHAAAHKHLAMMEQNVGEAVKNNLIATWKLGELSGSGGVETFVLVSTDKAVRPTSVMGATKRLAELVVQDLERRHDTAYLTVRFGNVLGSTGSVVPIFNDQIGKGGPVTVTDARMRRYFMSIPEASQLVLHAAALGTGGEIFILDMGTSVSILEMAEKLIRLFGFEPYRDIDIIFTGAGPEEKICEELSGGDERLLPTEDQRILVTRAAALPHEVLIEALHELERLCALDDAARMRQILMESVPEARLTVAGKGSSHQRR